MIQSNCKTNNIFQTNFEKHSMDNTIYNTENAIKLPIPLDAWKLISTEQAEVIVLKLKAGEKLESHKNNVNVMFYVLEGRGILEIDEEKLFMNKGDIILVKKEKQRGWENNSGSGLQLLVIKLI